MTMPTRCLMTTNLMFASCQLHVHVSSRVSCLLCLVSTSCISHVIAILLLYVVHIPVQYHVYALPV